ncbi:uridylate-specific endoribonuclease C-like [Acropora muricata]|uniref:uridylate-specific endoribonuclease C-like n=1 Tax=Acropora muricata TaxID=159855 RepID=UPI0034E57735
MATSCFVLFTLAFFPTTRAADLGKSVCQDMWNRAGNNLKIPSELGVASTGGVVPLFQVKPPGGTAKIGRPVFVKIKALLDTYFNNPSATSKKATEFIEAVTIPGGPIEIAFKYLQNNGIVDKNKKLDDFKGTLQQAWFGTYTKKGSGKAHSGFEHVFLGDLAKKDFKGFHNWYQFHLEQMAGQVLNPTYAAFHGSTQPAFISGLSFTWRTATKKAKAGSSMFVGTSPAFDLALFTVCFIALQGKPCSCNIGRSRITIQTFAAKASPTSPALIATAYPANVEMPAGRCNIPPDDDCGWVGIDQKHCEDRGCCWLPKDKTNWCFYPKDHKCHGIPPSKRQECGYLGIQREECEISRDCCFDHSIPNVPFCFKGNP